VLPGPDAAVARQVLAADVALLADLDRQIADTESRLAAVLPATPFAPLTTVPGWGTVRVGSYGAAVGDPARWPSPRQLYRAAGLSPTQYESAGKRRDGAISREGSVELRRALIDLGLGLWLADPAAKRYGQRLRARGKLGGIIACAMAHRANKIAFALGSGPNRLRPGSLGLTTARLSLIAALPVGAQELSTWSARSAARTNEVDRAEHRPTLRQQGKPGKRGDRRPFTTRPAGETLDRTKGRTRRRMGYGGPARVTPRLAWRPALRPHGSPNDVR
jgi:hypothetical protein